MKSENSDYAWRLLLLFVVAFTLPNDCAYHKLIGLIILIDKNTVIA